MSCPGQQSCSIASIKIHKNIAYNGSMKNQMQIHEMFGPMDGGMGWAKKLPTSDPG